MKNLRIPLALALLSAACTTPVVVAPAVRAEGFSLAQLKGQPLALWPVGTAYVDADAAVAQSVGTVYGSPQGLLDAVNRDLAQRLEAQGPPVLVDVARLAKALPDRSLLDPARAAADPAALARLPLLRGARYAILPQDLALGRKRGDGGMVGNGPGNGQSFIEDTGAVAVVGRLRLSVLDLGTGQVVWQGSLYAGGGFNGPRISANDLRDFIANLDGNLMRQLRPRPEPSAKGACPALR